MESTQHPQTEIKTDWIETLALEELNMDETGIIHINDHLNPSHLLEESSIQFMDQLRERVDIYVGRFNEYRGAASGSPTNIIERDSSDQVKIKCMLIPVWISPS